MHACYIRLKLSSEGKERVDPGAEPSAKRKQLSVEPSAQEERIQALNQVPMSIFEVF